MAQGRKRTSYCQELLVDLSVICTKSTDFQQWDCWLKGAGWDGLHTPWGHVLNLTPCQAAFPTRMFFSPCGDPIDPGSGEPFIAVCVQRGSGWRCAQQSYKQGTLKCSGLMPTDPLNLLHTWASIVILWWDELPTFNKADINWAQ